MQRDKITQPPTFVTTDNARGILDFPSFLNYYHHPFHPSQPNLDENQHDKIMQPQTYVHIHKKRGFDFSISIVIIICANSPKTW